MDRCIGNLICRREERKHGTLRGMVRSYILYKRPHAQAELDSFRNQQFEDALERAALAQDTCGKRLSHQRRIPLAVLNRARNIFRVAARELRTKGSFEDLHNSIKRILEGVRGLGELYRYDTALRIAANLGHRVMPKRVYLHRGTRDGARALDLDWRADSLDACVLPKDLAALEPDEVEDFLCIYKGQLANVRKPRLPT